MSLQTKEIAEKFARVVETCRSAATPALQSTSSATASASEPAAPNSAVDLSSPPQSSFVAGTAAAAAEAVSQAAAEEVEEYEDLEVFRKQVTLHYLENGQPRVIKSNSTCLLFFK